MTAIDDWHAVTLEIPFASPDHAEIAKRTIEVDAELQPHAVKRELIVEGNVLIARFHTRTVRLARLTANGFLENVDLVVKTLETFGDDAAAAGKS
ncbi:transcription factor Pcc1 [Cylindrobasidium torrendii FP15055 ss-10]|uniref:Transcription factor Pcc1 n=1 Tax=Cylindrobasidium torrendii FP15055 ss-10 TaxID=1314674 RepID=A0A0D7B9U0_9AGAR|nr:transcription factor Pcc1 [Cylindrobasidium torrendii FP15055 ss-10]